ncbi:leucine-rich repeat-containing protein 66 [Empidonax traillii]|uniref:leucine-rich repeat-containing protein 66 n=1 Tax=Empidonax traillii TaxID=164674 RepID=UPI000FFD54F1|nr:leucine-rich repeat-containing protein 66 [Empidonax traillii]XP_027755403.1 leucine-rich repeat-containing protein 66 [Empidonax traillii]
MDNLHLSVIAVVLYFNLPGSVGTKSQQILLATHHHSECQWDGQFLLNCSFTRISAIPEDISRTVRVADFSYNNIKTFLCTDGRNEEWMLKHLNLSNNLISELFLTACTNLPVLETLNLNGNAIHTLTLDIPVPAPGSKTHRIVDRVLPALKVLSVERNNLNTVPRGLSLLQSLQMVHMSSNSIQQIDSKDFQNCSQLKDVDLRNNKITKIHPDAFKNLNKLQVVDLRENPLMIPLPQILINLNFFQLEVYSSNNAWIFNCGLNAFKHLFHFPFDSTRKKWSLSYNQFANSQKPLLYLSSFHLNCRDSVLLKRATIPTGNTSVLNCNLDNTRDNGVSWWTPKGRISKNHSLPHMTLDKRNNLVIYNAEKTAEGLYLCIFNTTKEKYLIYNIQVKEKVSTFLVRKARDTNTVFRHKKTESDLALAVSLSVLITFVCAFCLGAFARPYLVSLWRHMCRNKNSGSEHTYSNQAFSDETLNREFSASNPTNTQRNVLICDENSSRNTRVFPTETSTSYENVTGSGAECQEQSNAEINMKKKPVFSEIQTSTDNYENANVYDNGLFSVKTESQNSSEVTPRQLMSNNTALRKDLTYTNNQDSEKSRIPPIPLRRNAHPYSNHNSSNSEKGETDFSFSTVQTHSTAQDSRNSKVSNDSGLLHSEITKATPDPPERKGIVLLNEPTHTTKFMHGRQGCDEQLGLSSNLNIPSDVGDFILPNVSERDMDTENLSSCETTENFPVTEYDCKRICSNEKDASADVFGDSSSDEGTPFSLSDCSSLEDFKLEQPDVSDNLPACQSSLEEANTNSGTEKLSTLPESPNIAAEVQHIGKNEDENTAYFETTINYGSDTTKCEITSPYTDEHGGHIGMSDPDTASSSSQEVPGTFGYFTNAESKVQNSDSLHSQSMDFDNMVLSLKHSSTYDTETENIPKEAELQLYPLPAGPQHSLSFSPRRLGLFPKENTSEESTDESIARKSPEKSHGEADITLGRNMHTSEDNGFIFAPIDMGLNEIVKKTSLLHSSNESSLQPLSEHRAEKHFMVITQQEDLLPQGKQENTTKAWADKMERGFDEKNCDGYTELQDTSNCSLPEETQSCNLTADLLHLPNSGRTQSVFTTDGHFQLDQSDKDTYSFSVPQGFFNESTQYSSHSFPQKPTGNIISKSTHSSKMEDDTTWTELGHNSTTAVEHLQNSSENLSQKSRTNSGQEQFFVKKKRAFDGFANILQSRTNFNS